MMILRCRWRRTYAGHFTKRLRSRCFGRMSLPSRKFFGVLAKRGLAFFSTFFLGSSALGAFLETGFFFPMAKVGGKRGGWVCAGVLRFWAARGRRRSGVVVVVGGKVVR